MAITFIGLSLFSVCMLVTMEGASSSPGGLEVNIPINPTAAAFRNCSGDGECLDGQNACNKTQVSVCQDARDLTGTADDSPDGGNSPGRGASIDTSSIVMILCVLFTGALVYYGGRWRLMSIRSRPTREEEKDLELVPYSSGPQIPLALPDLVKNEDVAQLFEDAINGPTEKFVAVVPDVPLRNDSFQLEACSASDGMDNIQPCVPPIGAVFVTVENFSVRWFSHLSYDDITSSCKGLLFEAEQILRGWKSLKQHGIFVNEDATPSGGYEDMENQP